VSTIKKMSSDKASRPDGLIVRFYHSCWPIIKHDIMATISAVWSRKMMGLAPLNTTYITPPQKRRCGTTKDFSLISLVHSFGKLLIKILPNRLVGRLHCMVFPNQSAFIKGCFIQENFMLVKQIARFCTKKTATYFW
jgi:hypothetical protein